jgi:Ca-activated chloride channel family protein
MFQYPEHLWLGLAAPLCLILWAIFQRWHHKKSRLFGKQAVPALPYRRFWAKGVTLATAFALLALAWANPQAGVKKQVSEQQVANVIFVLDISQSMLCRDVAPNRLELAKIFAQKAIKALEGEQIGLIFFAGNAFLAAPLSTDYTFLLQSLQEASPDLLSEQGTAIAPALRLAEQTFDEAAGGGRAVVLITDGEEHDDEALSSARELNGNGIIVIPVGAGTAAGAPVPGNDWEGSPVKRDQNGEIVRSRLNEQLLRHLASTSGTPALNISQMEQAVRAVANEVGQLEKRGLEIRSFEEKNNYFQWLLLPALLLFGLETFISLRPKHET